MDLSFSIAVPARLVCYCKPSTENIATARVYLAEKIRQRPRYPVSSILSLPLNVLVIIIISVKTEMIAPASDTFLQIRRTLSGYFQCAEPLSLL